jgi:hypothetical protein
MKWLTNIFERFGRCTSGTALIEAALVLPVAVILMVEVVDFGRFFMTRATAEKSMRDGVRYLTLLPAGAVCGWGLDNAKRLAVFGNLAGTGDPVVSGWATTDVSLSTPSTCTTSPLGVIRLTANVPFAATMWQAIGLPATITLSVQHEERWIGQ